LGCGSAGHGIDTRQAAAGLNSLAPAAALVADADETSNGGVAFGRSGANQQRSTVVRRRAIRPFVAAEFGFCLAAAPENGDVNSWGKRTE
jgi:hypothetical protein